MKKIILIAGKACAGKDTLVKRLMKELDLPMALSFTTRPMRTGETQGIEYDFIDDKSFWDLHSNDQLAEYTSYQVANGDTWYYGLTREELEKDDYVLAIVNPDGAEQIKKIYGDKVKVIYITADDKQRIIRYIERDKSNNVAEFCRRYIADERDFEGFEYNFKIENDKVEDAYRHLRWCINIIKGNDLLEDMRKEFARNPAKFFRRNDA